MEEFLRFTREELARRTKREDIEVTGGPYRGYDISVDMTGEHPVVDVYTPMRLFPQRVEAALDYAVQFILTH
ncbi:MAG: hypothetical protein HY687_00735 [Chloroflexi bacterium]|nr:hypothetical protein [Chloroflexota bacterium]